MESDKYGGVLFGISWPDFLLLVGFVCVIVIQSIIFTCVSKRQNGSHQLLLTSKSDPVLHPATKKEPLKSEGSPVLNRLVKRESKDSMKDGKRGRSGKGNKPILLDWNVNLQWLEIQPYILLNTYIHHTTILTPYNQVLQAWTKLFSVIKRGKVQGDSLNSVFFYACISNNWSPQVPKGRSQAYKGAAMQIHDSSKG